MYIRTGALVVLTWALSALQAAEAREKLTLPHPADPFADPKNDPYNVSTPVFLFNPCRLTLIVIPVSRFDISQAMC